jgi:hypothetical protein
VARLSDLKSRHAFFLFIKLHNPFFHEGKLMNQNGCWVIPGTKLKAGISLPRQPLSYLQGVANRLLCYKSSCVTSSVFGGHLVCFLSKYPYGVVKYFGYDLGPFMKSGLVPGNEIYNVKIID